MKKTVWKIVLAVAAVAVVIGVGVWMKNRSGGQAKNSSEAPVATTEAEKPSESTQTQPESTAPETTAAPETTTEAPTEPAFDGKVTITVQDTEQKVLASKEVGFKAGETIADLLQANFENVTIDNGMLMTIESLTTPADWSTYIAFYINGEYAMQGVMTQPFEDGDVIDFINTVYMPMPESTETEEEAYDGKITITVKDKEDNVLASKEVGFKAGETIADLLQANFENVTLDNGMLMTIESLTTPADWSSYIAFYINGEYAMEGVTTQPFEDGDVIDLIDTVYIP